MLSPMSQDPLPSSESPASPTRSAFQLAFDGPAVADGSMDVREITTALQGLDDLVQRSNELLNGETSKVTLRVVAGFEKGSFDVNLFLDQGLRDSLAVMLPALSALNASQILDIVLGTYGKVGDIVSGAAKIYKAFKGARPIETKSGDRANTTVLIFGDNNTVVTDSGTARLYNDDQVRAALTRTAQPLLHGGVDKLEVKRASQLIEKLERPDVGESVGLELVSAQGLDEKGPTRDIWVRVVKPNFDGGRWTFHDGSAKFGAEVEDRGFQERVDRREQGFFAGDTFLIRLRSIQHIDKNGGISTRNMVEKVLDQRLAPRQRRLLTSQPREEADAE
jgi:hypothetical protein